MLSVGSLPRAKALALTLVPVHVPVSGTLAKDILQFKIRHGPLVSYAVPHPTPTHPHSPVSKFPGCSDLRNPKLRQGAETERLGLLDLAGASLAGYGWEGGALLLVCHI